MTPFRALVLGIIQGLTEFLPISSSGHLLLAPRLFGWSEQPRAFDVALHIGTLFALALYFRRDWWELGRALQADVRHAGLRLGRWGPQGRLALLLVLATVPAVIAGTLLAEVADRLRAPGITAAMLVAVGLMMAATERWARHPAGATLDRLTLLRAAAVGVAQACALVPGVSRSGITITTGMLTGLSRATAARFSFLLCLPITLAAAVKELPALHGAHATGASALDLGIGIAASFAVGLLAIAFLLRFLAARSLYPFVWYRIALAAVVVLVR